LNSNPRHFGSFTFISVSFRESCLLVSWCAGDRCGMVCSNEDRGRSRRPIAEDQGWSHGSDTRWSGDREVGWRYMWFTPCTWRREARVFWLSLKIKVDGLSGVWPQNYWDDFSQFGLKTGGSDFLVWTSKPTAVVW
jgi:hypothetical protein